MDQSEQIRKSILGDGTYTSKVRILIDIKNSVLDAVIPERLVKKVMTQGMLNNFKHIKIATCE